MDSRIKFVVSRRGLLSLGSAALASAALAGCSSSSTDDADAEGSSAADDVTQLTVNPGTLTVATGDPAYTPWVMDDNPESGEGFEAALIYELAAEMGFEDDQVVWVRTSFDETYAPGEHDWDLNIQQVSITEDRMQAVDFSPAYFRPTQSVVTTKTSSVASATSCADFADATVAVMVGSTAYDFAIDLLKGGSDEGIEVYNDNSAAAQAVSAGQADCLVTDTPQAVYMVESEQVADGVVVGQIPGTEDVQGFGISLSKDSVLTPYVTEAMNTLLDNGTVESLQEEWLTAYTTDIPTLTE